MRLIPFALVLILSGCETHDRIMATNFEPRGPGLFSFKAPAGPQYPLDTPDGEASRMRMLDDWVANNSYCRKGYEIVSRNPIQRTPFVHDVFYEGRCKT